VTVFLIWRDLTFFLCEQYMGWNGNIPLRDCSVGSGSNSVRWMVGCLCGVENVNGDQGIETGETVPRSSSHRSSYYSGCSRVQSCLFWVLDHGSGWTGVPHFMAGGFGWYPAVGSKYNRRSIVVDRPHLVWTTSKSMEVITASLATLRNMNIFLQITISSSSRVPCISVAAAMKTRIGDRKAKAYQHGT
jgi:hypothetical protein